MPQIPAVENDCPFSVLGTNFSLFVCSHPCFPVHSMCALLINNVCPETLETLTVKTVHHYPYNPSYCSKQRLSLAHTPAIMREIVKQHRSMFPATHTLLPLPVSTSGITLGSNTQALIKAIAVRHVVLQDDKMAYFKRRFSMPQQAPSQRTGDHPCW